MKSSRRLHVVAGSLKLAYKISGEVAQRNGKVYARMFEGKRAILTGNYSHTNAVWPEQRDRNLLEIVQGHEAARAEQKAAHQVKLVPPHKLQLGHVLCASWSYDQTNVDYYQVVGLVGRRFVQVRRIGATVTEGSKHHSGQCVPLIDTFRGNVITRRVSEYSGIKIGRRYTILWDGRPRFCLLES